MKSKCVAGVCFMFILLGVKGWAQTESLPQLEISTNKTTLIVSHFTIRSVDRGSRDVLVQKVKGVDTILEVKAARANFPQTNLTLLTGDGSVHMFLVTYNPTPPLLRYTFSSGGVRTDEGQADPGRIDLTEAGYEQIGDSILRCPARFRRIHDRCFGTRLNLAGIYIHEEALFFRFHLKNESNIPYDIAQLTFYIRDKNQSKRTASQDLSQRPLFFGGRHDRLDGKSTLDFVTALPKFTIPDKKVLFIVLKEVNGGRLLRLRIKNRQLMRAREI